MNPINPAFWLINCKFSSDSKQAFNIEFIKADLNKQVFDYNNNDSLLYSMKLWFIVASFGVVFWAVAAVFIVKKKNKENADIEKMEENYEILTVSLF